MKKPKGLKDEYIEFLNESYKKGNFNIFESLPYFIKKFSLLKEDSAIEIVNYWMKTYSEKHRGYIEEYENFEDIE